jgi:hypothetical protein
MLKKFFSFNNPVGLVLSSAVLILTVSPQARKGTRKLLVKGTGAVLALGDQMKGLTIGVQKQLGSFMEKAKADRELTNPPHLSEMVKEGVDMVRHGVEEVATHTAYSMEISTEAADDFFDDFMVSHVSEEPVSKTNYSMEVAKEDTSDAFFKKIRPVEIKKQITAYNVLNDHSIKIKLTKMDDQLH